MLRQRGFLLLNLAHFFDHFVLLILPTAALAIERAGGLDYAGALAPATWAFTAFAAATLPAGWLGDRWSRVGMMRVYWFGTGLACLVAGFAGSSGGLTLGLVLIGVFAAIYHPVATAMVMGWKERAGQALAVNGVFGNMGVAAAALVTALLAEWLGWRAAFLVPGFAMLALGCWHLTVPASEQMPVAVKGRGPARTAADRETQRRVFLFILVSGLFGGLVFNGATIALPKLIGERLPGTSLLGVGAVAGLVFAAAAFAQLPVGRLLDAWGARRLLLLLESLKVPLLFALALTPGAGGAALALPVMLLVFGEIPIAAWLLGRHLGERWWSRAYAAQYLLSLGVAAATVPLIAALHRATGDQTTLFLLLAASSAVILLAVRLVPGGTAPPVPAPAATVPAR